MPDVLQTSGGGEVKKREPVEPALIDVGHVAALLGCSTKHVFRLVDQGAMPAPVKLGGLVRWNRKSVLDWIESGCAKPTPVPSPGQE